jgi:hypothetical protein
MLKIGDSLDSLFQQNGRGSNRTLERTHALERRVD